MDINEKVAGLIVAIVVSVWAASRFLDVTQLNGFWWGVICFPIAALALLTWFSEPPHK